MGGKMVRTMDKKTAVKMGLKTEQKLELQTAAKKGPKMATARVHLSEGSSGYELVHQWAVLLRQQERTPCRKYRHSTEWFHPGKD